VLFSGTFALGILIISRADSYTTDLFGYLFGDVLSITVGDLWTIGILGMVVLALVAVFYRQLLFVAFDRRSRRLRASRRGGWSIYCLPCLG
jgi:ABC-type Mn2+/Zn2+ transport system permease subunit